ncbi:MAG TPA: zf-HC2 domain-containing protein [Actinomycetota bacterium]
MTCRELTRFLDGYLSGELGPDERASFEAHLDVCEDCVAYLDGYRRTVALAEDALRAADELVPDDVPAALVDAILAARGKR